MFIDINPTVNSYNNLHFTFLISFFAYFKIYKISAFFSIGMEFLLCLFFCLLFEMIFKKKEKQEILHYFETGTPPPNLGTLNRPCHG